MKFDLKWFAKRENDNKIILQKRSPFVDFFPAVMLPRTVLP